MCFGDMKKTGESTSTTTMPSWLSGAASGNLDYVKGLMDKGFTPYGGKQVADFSEQQRASFGLGNQISGGISPYVGQTGALISNYANAGPQSVNANTISSAMSPYMNQYVSQALAPQLEAQNQQFAQQNKGFDAQAAGAGAFGDSGWGIGRSNLTNQQNIGRTGLIGNAYNAAFNTAIGAGAQDVSNNLQSQMANAGYNETALGRQLTGARELAGQGTNAANLMNMFGGQQTAQDQAGLNAQYNQWMMAQNYPMMMAQLMNQSIGAGRQGAGETKTGTTSSPDNSGWGMIGSVLGSVGSAAKNAVVACRRRATPGRTAGRGRRARTRTVRAEEGRHGHPVRSAS